MNALDTLTNILLNAAEEQNTQNQKKLLKAYINLLTFQKDFPHSTKITLEKHIELINNFKQSVEKDIKTLYRHQLNSGATEVSEVIEVYALIENVIDNIKLYLEQNVYPETRKRVLVLGRTIGEAEEKMKQMLGNKTIREKRPGWFVTNDEEIRVQGAEAFKNNVMRGHLFDEAHVDATLDENIQRAVQLSLSLLGKKYEF